MSEGVKKPFAPTMRWSSPPKCIGSRSEYAHLNRSSCKTGKEYNAMTQFCAV
jgi:hypothetical protein